MSLSSKCDHFVIENWGDVRSMSSDDSLNKIAKNFLIRLKK